MMKFACFERTVEALYKFVVPKPRADCTKGEQLVVTFVAGYIGKQLFILLFVLVLSAISIPPVSWSSVNLPVVCISLMRHNLCVISVALGWVDTLENVFSRDIEKG
jgi:hypothetical protein